MNAKATAIGESESMCVRAAWLHHAGGYTQAAVAKKLGVSNLKAHRLITRANKEGMVKVFIDGEIAECALMENTLADHFGLEYCEVVPDLEEPGIPLRALGSAGASYLKRVLENSDLPSIGIGHGRTLAACVHHLPKTPASNKSIVSLLGGFSRAFNANPHDVIHGLAEKTGAAAYVMPVPFFVNKIKDKKVILAQAGISEVLVQARETSIKLVGIGSVDNDASIVASEMVESAEMEAVEEAGGIGEVLGYFYNADGELVKTDLSDRTMGLEATDLPHSNLVAVAGGEAKAGAIHSILNSGLLNGLITDERTARMLINKVGKA